MYKRRFMKNVDHHLKFNGALYIMTEFDLSQC